MLSWIAIVHLCELLLQFAEIFLLLLYKCFFELYLVLAPLLEYLVFLFECSYSLIALFLLSKVYQFSPLLLLDDLVALNDTLLNLLLE